MKPLLLLFALLVDVCGIRQHKQLLVGDVMGVDADPRRPGSAAAPLVSGRAGRVGSVAAGGEPLAKLEHGVGELANHASGRCTKPRLDTHALAAVAVALQTEQRGGDCTRTSLGSRRLASGRPRLTAGPASKLRQNPSLASLRARRFRAQV